jgi:hypothetical protein
MGIGSGSKIWHKLIDMPWKIHVHQITGLGLPVVISETWLN